MIIVEACGNWSSIAEAKHIIQVARNVNPDGLVKFQLCKPSYNAAKSHELTFEQAKELFDYGASIRQEVFFSVFGVQYVDWCERIGVKRYKIPFSEKQNAPLIKAIRNTRKQILVSLYIPYTEAECEVLHRLWAKRLAPPNTKTLFCIPPANPKQFVYFTSNWFAPFDGFSDRSIGLDAAKIAFARGAQIVEKHFILEHNSIYPDDAWSMTPSDLRELVRWETVL